MRIARAACLVALSLSALAECCAQRPPAPTQLPGDVFVIKNTWYIGGTGSWDYLTMDAAAHRLFIAHSHTVQAVDAETGTLAGQVTGLHEAHSIALDSAGQYGYVSDGLADEVKIFDRQTFQVVASVRTGSGPRALALDPQSGLLFAICTTPLTDENSILTPPAQPPPAHKPSAEKSNAPAPRSSGRNVTTSISVIDVAARRRIGEILLRGQLGFAQADGDGMLYVLVADRGQIMRVDCGAIASLLHTQPEAAATSVAAQPEPAAGSPAEKPEPRPTVLDWTNENQLPEAAQTAIERYGLSSACRTPLSLATDGAHQRVFIACDNLRLTVLNGGNGQVVTTLPIGPGPEAVAYDADRGLIYAAAGDAQGLLTIIRQDVTDTYNVIQNLPTRERARTLAVNTETGEVYLVTDISGVALTSQGGIGTLKSKPVNGSFGVLVVGH